MFVQVGLVHLEHQEEDKSLLIIFTAIQKSFYSAYTKYHTNGQPTKTEMGYTQGTSGSRATAEWVQLICTLNKLRPA